MPEKLTEAELNQKLSTIGLPTYGTYEEKLARFELHSKPVAFKKSDGNVVVIAPAGISSQSEMDAVVADAKPFPEQPKGALVGEAAKGKLFGKKGKK